MKKRTLLKTALSAAALSASLAVYAAPTIIVTDGVVSSGPITSPGSGTALYVNGAFDASWNVVITAGSTKPIFGNAADPDMEIDVQATATGATPIHDLTVIFSDTDFGPTSGQFSGLTTGQAIGSSGGTVTFNTYYDAGNVLGAQTSPLTASGGIAGPTYTSLNQTTATLGAPYSLTEVVTISGTPAASYSVGANLSAISAGCPCSAHDIQYNFNGTQIIFQSTPGGSYVWFISDGKVTGVPTNKKSVLHISSQSITIPATGSSPAYVIPVPDSFITFDPAVTVATTTFDTVNNVWRMSFPVTSMSGNIFYGAAAFKVPAAGLPGGIKNVDWTGTFTTDTAGLGLNWQWSAANYSNFTSSYNSIAPKPTDDNSKSNYKNSDHAGTPEGTDPVSGKLWKTFVVGGASGGGGANYTGSGSSTINVPPCVCPNP